MLTHSLRMSHAQPMNSGQAPYPYEGRPDGMAADGQFRSALTVLQNVPNIGISSTAPKTQVNATLEQGFGRAPGWKMGWMRKNIPWSRSVINHNQARLGQIRVEGILASGAHQPGRGLWQDGRAVHRQQRGTIPDPVTVYLTAAVPPQGAGYGGIAFGEPV